jgi:diadenylate cyclase
MTPLLDQLQFLRPGPADLIEIAIVAVLFYRILVLVQRTRAFQMLLGVVTLALVYGVARILGFQLIETILETVFQYGAIALLVVFQPELRSALARLGQSRMMRVFNKLEGLEVVDEIVEACRELSRSKVGAIIAIEQEVGLDEYADSGKPVNAPVSTQMLTTIFTPYSPLHDGAVIVRGDVISVAGAILPLTQYPVEDKSLGTRHRAAIGLTDETDAVVVVVSEETSRISVAQRGRIEVGVDAARLRQLLAGAIPEVSAPLQVQPSVV